MSGERMDQGIGRRDQCGVCSDVDNVPVCCGEEIADLKESALCLPCSSMFLPSLPTVMNRGSD